MLVSLEAAPPVAKSTIRFAGTRLASPGRDDPFALLEAAYRCERHRLLRFLARRAGIDAAPDLLHEVFLRAVASPQAAKLINPVGFLYRIAHNLLIDRARRSRRQFALLPLCEAHAAPSRAEQEQGIEAQDLQAVIDRALADLPAKTRRVFELHRRGGMTYREIQAALGISVATVEYHMMRALGQLRRAAQTECGHAEN